MSKRTHWIAAVGLVALLVTGGLFASNMGFKLNYLILGPTGSGGNGTNALALPFNWQTNLTDAFDLGTDIGGFTATGGPIIQMIQLEAATGSTNTYTGGTGDPNNFSLSKGEGYRLQVNTDVPYIVVGSHDPSNLVTLLGPTGGGGNGTNDFSVPYHTTNVDAFDLMTELGGPTATGGIVIQSIDLVAATGQTKTYTAGTGDPNNFALLPGKSYRVQMTTDKAFIPAHY